MSGAKVFLGGEGKNELGSRYGDPVYQSDESPGVIEALLRRVRPHGWTVMGARRWREIHKLRAKGPTPNDEQNVLGLALEARRAGANVLAFTRDADDDHQRPRLIAEAIRLARQQNPAVSIVGAAAVPVLEAWILALQGESGTESMGKAAAQKRLIEKGIEAKNTQAMVDVVTKADINALPKDAESLRGWLANAANALPTSSAES